MDRIPIKRVLISVSDKSGLAELAKELTAAGAEIYSTGGTRKFLSDHGFASREVAEYTAFPEMMHGRVKTLHPKIFGGILCRRDHPEDIAACREHGIELIDLVVVNLYPFEQTIARGGVTSAEAIENIDIGGRRPGSGGAQKQCFTPLATRPGGDEASICAPRAG